MKKFGPLSVDHPSVGEKCPACMKPFVAGDYTTLVPLGPGDDEEARRKAKEGRIYIAVAAHVHWDCSPYVESQT
jgi:hypothetical protein